MTLEQDVLYLRKRLAAIEKVISEYQSDKKEEGPEPAPHNVVQTKRENIYARLRKMPYGIWHSADGRVVRLLDNVAPSTLQSYGKRLDYIHPNHLMNAIAWMWTEGLQSDKKFMELLNAAKNLNFKMKIEW